MDHATRIAIPTITITRRGRPAGYTSSGGDNTTSATTKKTSSDDSLQHENQQLLSNTKEKEYSQRPPHSPRHHAIPLKKTDELSKTSPRKSPRPLLSSSSEDFSLRTVTQRSPLPSPRTKSGTSNEKEPRSSPRRGETGSLSKSKAFLKDQELKSRLVTMATTSRLSVESHREMEVEDDWFNDFYSNPLTFVTENKAATMYGSYACSFVNVVARQFVSVLIPTYIRQVLAWSIERGTENKPELRWVIAGVAVAYPILLNIIGAVVDRYVGGKMEKIVEEFCNEIESTILGAHSKEGNLSINTTDIRNFRLDMEKKLIEELENNNEISAKIVKTFCKKIDDRRQKRPDSGLSISEPDDEYLLSERTSRSAKGTIQLEDDQALTSDLLNELFKKVKPEIELEIANLKKELGDKYWDTPSSNLCRLINGVVLIASSVGAGYLGVLPNVASRLVAFGVYCILRDAVQSVLPLNDGIKKFYLCPTGGAAVAYGVNQTIVNQFASVFAEFSGQGASKLPYEFVAKNDILRSIFNCLGEIADLYTLVALQGRAAKKNLLVIKLQPEIPSLNQVIKTVTGTHAARVAMFFAFLVIDEIISSQSNLEDRIAHWFWRAFAISGIGGGLIMLGYTVFLAI